MGSKMKWLAMVAACAAVAAGCGTAAVPQDEVEEQVSTALEGQTGQAPESVSCPGDLDAEVGTTMTCTLNTADDMEFDVNLEVNSVEGDTAMFDIEVADEPN